MDKAESAGTPTGIVLLDWEKAFDKITRPSLHKTLRRFRIPAELIDMVASIYQNITFYVGLNGQASTQLTQHTGIRQGCPLSP